MNWILESSKPLGACPGLKKVLLTCQQAMVPITKLSITVQSKGASGVLVIIGHIATHSGC